MPFTYLASPYSDPDPAIRLGDEGTIRQKIMHLGLHRSNFASKVLSSAPDHLKTVLIEQGPKVFLEQVYAWRDQQAQDLANSSAEHRATIQAELAKRLTDIDLTPAMSRNEKIMAKRLAGATLEQIGQQYGLTRERVRQLTSPDYVKETRQTRIATMINDQVVILNQMWDRAHSKAREAFLKNVVPQKDPS